MTKEIRYFCLILQAVEIIEILHKASIKNLVMNRRNKHRDMYLFIVYFFVVKYICDWHLQVLQAIPQRCNKPLRNVRIILYIPN